MIRLKRVYEPATAEDGLRVLVERLWPRGVSKDAACIDVWSKDTAPTPELRQWFGHAPDRWAEFQTRYFAELDDRVEAVDTLIGQIGDQADVTFVFAAKDEEHNNAAALRTYLEARL